MSEADWCLQFDGVPDPHLLTSALCLRAAGIEGIKVRTALSEEVLAAFVIDDIRFTTCIPHGKTGDIFCVLQKDANLGVVHCHAYLCPLGRATPIADAISAAFMHYQVRSSTDPFQAVGKRLAAPEDLFRRQLHRADLAAGPAIGAGQFGQVYAATQTMEGGETEKCAVKMLRGTVTDVAVLFDPGVSPPPFASTNTATHPPPPPPPPCMRVPCRVVYATLLDVLR